MYSWNAGDPATDDPNAVIYHGNNRGSASLNLLGGIVNPPPKPPGTESFTITVPTVSLRQFFA